MREKIQQDSHRDKKSSSKRIKRSIDKHKSSEMKKKSHLSKYEDEKYDDKRKSHRTNSKHKYIKSSNNKNVLDTDSSKYDENYEEKMNLSKNKENYNSSYNISNKRSLSYEKKKNKRRNIDLEVSEQKYSEYKYEEKILDLKDDLKICDETKNEDKRKSENKYDINRYDSKNYERKNEKKKESYKKHDNKKREEEKLIEYSKKKEEDRKNYRKYEDEKKRHESKYDNKKYHEKKEGKYEKKKYEDKKYEYKRYEEEKRKKIKTDDKKSDYKKNEEKKNDEKKHSKKKGSDKKDLYKKCEEKRKGKITYDKKYEDSYTNEKNEYEKKSPSYKYRSKHRNISVNSKRIYRYNDHSYISLSPDNYSKHSINKKVKSENKSRSKSISNNKLYNKYSRKIEEKNNLIYEEKYDNNDNTNNFNNYNNINNNRIFKNSYTMDEDLKSDGYKNFNVDIKKRYEKEDFESDYVNTYNQNYTWYDSNYKDKIKNKTLHNFIYDEEQKIGNKKNMKFRDYKMKNMKNKLTTNMYHNNLMKPSANEEFEKNNYINNNKIDDNNSNNIPLKNYMNSNSSNILGMQNNHTMTMMNYNNMASSTFKNNILKNVNNMVYNNDIIYNRNNNMYNENQINLMNNSPSLNNNNMKNFSSLMMNNTIPNIHEDHREFFNPNKKKIMQPNNQIESNNLVIPPPPFSDNRFYNMNMPMNNRKSLILLPNDNQIKINNMNNTNMMNYNNPNILNNNPSMINNNLLNNFNPMDPLKNRQLKVPNINNVMGGDIDLKEKNIENNLTNGANINQLNIPPPPDLEIKENKNKIVSNALFNDKNMMDFCNDNNSSPSQSISRFNNSINRNNLPSINNMNNSNTIINNQKMNNMKIHEKNAANPNFVHLNSNNIVLSQNMNVHNNMININNNSRKLNINKSCNQVRNVQPINVEDRIDNNEENILGVNNNNNNNNKNVASNLINNMYMNNENINNANNLNYLDDNKNFNNPLINNIATNSNSNINDLKNISYNKNMNFSKISNNILISKNVSNNMQRADVNSSILKPPNYDDPNDVLMNYQENEVNAFSSENNWNNNFHYIDNFKSSGSDEKIDDKDECTNVYMNTLNIPINDDKNITKEDNEKDDILYISESYGNDSEIKYYKKNSRKELTKEEKLHEWLEKQLANQTNIISDAFHLIPLFSKNIRKSNFKNTSENNKNIDEETMDDDIENYVSSEINFHTSSEQNYIDDFFLNFKYISKDNFSFKEKMSYKILELEDINNPDECEIIINASNNNSINDLEEKMVVEQNYLNNLRDFILSNSEFYKENSTFLKKENMEETMEECSNSKNKNNSSICSNMSNQISEENNDFLTNFECTNENLFSYIDDKKRKDSDILPCDNLCNNNDNNENRSNYFLNLMKSNIKNPFSLKTDLCKKDKLEQVQNDLISKDSNKLNEQLLQLSKNTDPLINKKNFSYKLYLLSLMLQKHLNTKHINQENILNDKMNISSINLFFLNNYTVTSEDTIHPY